MLLMFNTNCSLGSSPTAILNLATELGRDSMPSGMPENVASYMQALSSGIAMDTSNLIEVPRYVIIATDTRVPLAHARPYLCHSKQIQSMRRAANKLLAPCMDSAAEISSVHLKALREYVSDVCYDDTEGMCHSTPIYRSCTVRCWS